MNRNFLRIGIAALLAIGILTFFVLLFECPDPLLWVAFGWIVWSIVVFAGGLCFWAAGRKTAHMLNFAYLPVLKTYSVAAMILAVIIGVLDYTGIWMMPIKWFCLLEVLVLALAVWKILVMNTARDAILTAEKTVETNTVSWKLLIADITAAADRGAAEDKKALNRAAEAIRYADPMDHPAVADTVQQIKRKVTEIKIAVENGKSDEIAALCVEVELLVKERNAKLLIVK